jgi:hypothetical protein
LRIGEAIGLVISRTSMMRNVTFPGRDVDWKTVSPVRGLGANANIGSPYARAALPWIWTG